MYEVAPATLFQPTLAVVPLWVPLSPVGAAGGLLGFFVVAVVVGFLVVVVGVAPLTVTVVLLDAVRGPLTPVTVTLWVPAERPVNVAEELRALTVVDFDPTVTL